MKKFFSKAKKVLSIIPMFIMTKIVGLFTAMSTFAINDDDLVLMQFANKYGADVTTTSYSFWDQFSQAPTGVKVGSIALIIGLGLLAVVSKVKKLVKIIIVTILAIAIAVLAFLYGKK